MRTKAPSKEDLASELGAAEDIWNAIIALVTKKFGSIDQEWKPSKASFGQICLLRHKKRTLLYLTPDKEMVRVAIVLGERAVVLVLASELPEGIKTLIREARPYAEGRGIRFPVSSAADMLVVSDLVVIKTTPR
ncbi:MAG: DUF3788 family protein [Coprothermobacterota bacterium]|nr:DUF3788 family protein [Coprothermobacterota bacterium]